MWASNRGTVRHPRFIEATEALSRTFANAEQVIDGAVWEIERNPERIGIYIPQLDVYQARLVVPPALLIYCIHRRYVMMLTIVPTEGSLEF